MITPKELKTSRLEIRIKPSVLSNLNKIRGLCNYSQAEFIEYLIEKIYAEYQKEGIIERGEK